MEDKESGSLSEKSTLDLIVELYRGNVTGSLKLERAPLQKAVYFRDGQILFAASNDPKDQLASILVEEGKLGPDQMQVAQARVSAGNPLAKVLTELGYISQRELADAARIKVEKILTDLYTWTEGTYQFQTKSLPKGAIDLDLSTPQLIYSSIGRIQDRDWILRQLGSLDAVIAAGPTLDNFIIETKADDQASEVLRHADGIKSVTQIGALSSLGEFEVCKILTAGLVAGALTKAGGAAVPGPVTAPDDAFSMPSEPPTFNPGPSSAAIPLGGLPTVGLETNPPPSPATDDAFRAPTDDTVFEAPPKPNEPEQMEKTVFEAAPGIPSGLPTVPGPTSMPEELPSMDFGAPNATASELLIDEPEPEGDDSDYSSSRMPPRPKGRRGSASSGNLMGFLKIAGVIVLVAAAAFSVYYFIWPMFAGEGEEGDSPLTATATTTPPSPSPTSTPPAASSSSPDAPDTNTPAANTDPRATGASSGPRPAPAPTPRPAPTDPQPAPAPAPAPTPTSATRRPEPTPAPRPSPSPSGTTRGGSGSGNGRRLLAGGDISGAADAFLRELRSSGQNKFTVAVGLYCNEDNVGRVVSNARGSEQLYVLPTTIQGRQCFRVVWGTFDTRQAAEQGMGSVPNDIRAGDAAAVPVASVLR